MENEMLEQKSQLRKHLKKLRKELGEEARDKYSQTVVQKILASQPYQEAQCIFVYSPMGTELKLSYLFEPAEAAGKRLVFPVTFEEGRMEAYAPRDRKQMQLDSWGFATPDPTRDTLVAPEEIDLVLAPLLGFDQERYRIGYGGGFYDRFIKRLRADACTMGVAFAAQEVLSIPHEEHDQILDIIITEKDTLK